MEEDFEINYEEEIDEDIKNLDNICYQIEKKYNLDWIVY